MSIFKTSLLPPSLYPILSWGFAQCFFEEGDEGADGVVAEFFGDGLDRQVDGEFLQGENDVELAAPLAEGELHMAFDHTG